MIDLGRRLRDKAIANKAIANKAIAKVRADLERDDLTPSGKAILMSERALSASHIRPRIDVGRILIFELDHPPKVMRGLRDLVIRRADPSEAGALAAVAVGTPDQIEKRRTQNRERFDRGDLVYVGQLGDRMLCHLWLHPGPEPIDEDARSFARWKIPAHAFWSYNAATSGDTMASGVFIKVFQQALADLFEKHGAQSVLCMVRHWNQSSIAMHDRNGFRRVGEITSIALPFAKLLLSSTGGRWIAPRSGELTIALPDPNAR